MQSISPIAGALLHRMGPAWAVALDMAVSAALVVLDVAGWPQRRWWSRWWRSTRSPIR